MFNVLMMSLQRKIDKFLALKKIGKSFNAEVRNRKDYRNPDFLLHAVRYQDIDQIGSCFSKDVFDPHGYDKSDYYDEIGHLLSECVCCLFMFLTHSYGTYVSLHIISDLGFRFSEILLL